MSDLSEKCRTNCESGAVWGNVTVRALCDEVELLERQLEKARELFAEARESHGSFWRAPIMETYDQAIAEVK